jgi:hypothetical protein
MPGHISDLGNLHSVWFVGLGLLKAFSVTLSHIVLNYVI